MTENSERERETEAIMCNVVTGWQDIVIKRIFDF